MNILVAIGTGLAASLAVPGAALATSPAPAPAGTTVPPTKVPLVNDCGNGAVNGECVTLDNTGTFAGVVKYRHKRNGSLRLMIVAKAAAPQRAYQLEIYCGSGPAKAGNQVGVLAGAVHTDAAGFAVAGPFEVPAADLREACGAATIGHLQLVDLPGGSILTAAPITMTPA